MSERPLKIRIRDLRKRFGAKQVLAGVDLDVAESESVVVIGGSGTGKSVLLKCILGLLEPDHGSILIDGQEVVGLGRRAREQIMQKFGMLFQSAALFDSLPVWENVAFGLLNIKKLGRAEAKEQAIETLGQVGLGADVADLWPAELSGGMRKRVGIARAIVGEPKYILYDEPTSGLDPVNSDIIDRLVMWLADELKVTSVMVTHDVRGAFRVADRLALLSDGRVLMQGTQKEFLASEDPKVKEFLERDFDNPSFAA
jgi:phospholipid/cholesterol/gamma-HCH transport system ATP-binding protein